MTRLESRLKDAEATVRAIEQQRTLRDQAAADLTALDAQLQSLPEMASNESALATVQARITKGREHLALAEDHVRAARAWASYDERLAAARQDQADLERLCQAYGPKGIRERLLGERLGALTDRVNLVLGHFGRAVQFEVDPWAIRLDGVPPQLMAKSALFRIGLAFQISLAEVTGLKFAVIDGLDILDAANRATLFSVLDRALAEGWIEQVVILATALSAAASTKAWPENWRVFWIERDGEASHVRPIESAAAVAA